MKTFGLLVLILLVGCGHDEIPAPPKEIPVVFDPGANPDTWCSSIISEQNWTDNSDTYSFQKFGCKLLKNGVVLGIWWHRTIENVWVRLDGVDPQLCRFSLSLNTIECPFAILH